MVLWKNTVLAAVLLLVAGLCFIMAGRAAAIAPAAPSAAPLSDGDLLLLLGGCLDEECNPTQFTCNDSWGYPCDEYTEGRGCNRCVSDAPKEACQYDNWCIPFVTCNYCIEDDPHECGKVTTGVCIDGICDTADVGTIDCGTAPQCHEQ